MSADYINVCPACYSRETGKPFIEVTLDDLNAVLTGGSKVGISTELREYHDPYIDRGTVYFDFSATCGDCGYTFSAHMSAPMSEPRKS